MLTVMDSLLTSITVNWTQQHWLFTRVQRKSAPFSHTWLTVSGLHKLVGSMQRQCCCQYSKSGSGVRVGVWSGYFIWLYIMKVTWTSHSLSRTFFHIAQSDTRWRKCAAGRKSNTLATSRGQIRNNSLKNYNIRYILLF